MYFRRLLLSCAAAQVLILAAPQAFAQSAPAPVLPYNVGASPFLSIQSAFVILVCYLLFSAYNYVRTIAHHARTMAYIGLSPSEFRILMAAWPFMAPASGVDEMASDGPSRLDTAILILAAFAVIGLAAKALADAQEIAAGE
ncbi:hypothetical protein [Methylosinus sporium]|uniref:hypothetical protein n=1 Tax=Methylosinus sporium TaxID=428 RepID=UPI00383B8798